MCFTFARTSTIQYLIEFRKRREEIAMMSHILRNKQHPAVVVSNSFRIFCFMWYYLFPVVTQTTASFHQHHHHPTAFIPCHRYHADAVLYAVAPTCGGSNSGSSVIGNDTTTTDDCWDRHPRIGSILLNDNESTSCAARRRWMIGSLLTAWTASLTTKTVANAATTTTAPTTITTPIPQRLQTSNLQQPTIGKTTYSSVGDDMTTYPYYMEGIWDVTQTLINVETPMGLQYAGGPNGLIDIATKSIQESKSQIGKPIHLQLRYIQCQLKATTTTDTILRQQKLMRPMVVVLEDRLYNTRQRLNQFAGIPVVANVQYADTKGSNRETMQDLYDCITPATTITTTEMNDVPLTTTLTYFKGPAAQKVFVLGHHDADATPNKMDDATTTANACSSSSSLSSLSTFPSWTGYEYQRSIFALTNGNTAPPITTDTELIYQFTPIIDCTTTTTISHHNNNNNNPIRHVRGKLRIVGYLNPNDKYYFDVKNRAVTVQDYILDMKRVISS